MNDLNVGDRVRIISAPKFIELTGAKSIIGMTGTIKELNETNAGVEFDDYIGGHYGNWDGKDGHCWYVLHERLEKIEETEEETEKRKPYIPKKYGEDYFFLSGEYDGNKNIKFWVLQTTWTDNSIDYGMLLLGNVFRSEEEALENKDKFVKKLEKLRKGE